MTQTSLFLFTESYIMHLARCGDEITSQHSYGLQGVILLKACADVLMPWGQGSCSLSTSPFISGQMVVFVSAGRCVAYTVLSQPVLLIALNPDINPSV